MILLLGRRGQLATAFQRVISNDKQMLVLGREECDLSRPEAISKVIHELRPRLIVNCAAYTQVDRAETEVDACARLNHHLLHEVGAAAKGVGSRVLHFSTDYVYAGAGDLPQGEDSGKAPAGVYGKTKLAGDEALLGSGAVCHVIRVSWVYSPWGTNFVKTIMRLAREREELTVVADQIGCPMSAMEIAGLMAETCLPRLLERDCEDRAVFNLSAGSPASWYEFAGAILEEMRRRGEVVRVQRLLPIPSEAYPTPAKRPKNSRMDDRKFVETFGRSMPDWRQSLSRVMDKLLADRESA